METDTDKKAPSVIVYSTSWCGFCKSLKQYLDQNQVGYKDKNIETDESAYTELMNKIGGSGNFAGVPVTDIGGEIIVGFDRPKINQLLGI